MTGKFGQTGEPEDPIEAADTGEVPKLAEGDAGGVLDKNAHSPRISGFVSRAPDANNENPLEGLDDVEVLCHEIGNKLGTVMQAANLLGKQLKGNPEVDKNLHELLEILDVEHMGMFHLLKRVRKHAGGNEQTLDVPLLPEELPEYKTVDLSEILDAEVKLWRRLLRMDINITKDIPEGVKMKGDNVELHEIIHNIFRNAIQVMQNLPEEERKIHVSIREEKDVIQIFIQDNGPGIKTDDLLKLFTKGFTKKNGKGIGLFYSQKLAKKMGGDITLINNMDREDLQQGERYIVGGATAVIEFPAIEKV